LRFLESPDVLRHPEYKPGTGFFMKTETGIHLVDRDGRLLADWRPEMRGYPSDLERDAAGRWYISWDTGVMEVFSPERTHLSFILTASGGYLLRHRNGELYAKSLEGFQLIKIIPGF
jgi:hypothetical protein